VYVYPFVEANTRTVRVRLELPNRDGRLKPGMYANVTLEAPVGMSTTIPVNALLDSGSRRLVFVAEGDGYFQPRDVRVGLRLGDRVQILEGLEEGERVASSATFFLDSESQLRASVQAFEPAPEMAGARSGERLDITFRTSPDPPRTGDNAFEVVVRDAEGQPVSGADVSVTFFMAAMPSMNMPAMRTQATLPAVGAGTYRGQGQVIMSGRWDVTVEVSRDGRRLGSRQFGVVAQ
jgi:Cu(I)/Ag(I) efflux system membrane fusion protein/cobalt-zinc-cadmium efflux system membrane fusion protein